MSSSPRYTYTQHWSSGAFITRHVPVPNVPTHFERLVTRAGLQNHPEMWRYENTLVRFARNQHKTKYIPEWFLKELGLGDWEVGQ